MLNKTAALLLMISLAACGGSGSSSTAVIATPPPVSASPLLASPNVENEANQAAFAAIANDLNDLRAGLLSEQLVSQGALPAASASAVRVAKQRRLARLGSAPGAASTPWNGMVTINLERIAGSPIADKDVYWAIVGRSWQTDKFIHVDKDGKFVDMSLADNGALVRDGIRYTNYFHSLAESKSVTIPAINSVRILLSIGQPMYIQTNSDINGNLGYAGANIENPSDPNLDIPFDFVELAIVNNPATKGIWANTTRVDHFGFPVRLTLEGNDGYRQVVGEDGSETRADLLARFVAEVPAEFVGLAKPPLRIVAPAHDSFHGGEVNANYLDSYIDEIWQQYATQDLLVDIELGHFVGRVREDGRMVFTDAEGEYPIRRRPTTSEVLLGDGVLNDPGPLVGQAYNKVLQLQAQLCAALNRHVAEDASKWRDFASFYQRSPNNAYSAFWHRHNVNGLSYGFAYDDVSDASPSLYWPSPTVLTVAIGW
ncbi:MAG: glycoside hydrolase family 64 protein [Janthinobacterium lividum]